MTMQQWEDWNEEGKLSDSWLYLRLVLFLCTGLTIPWLYITWSAQRKEAPAQYSVELPERLRSGKSYEVNDGLRIEDERNARAIHPLCPADGTGLQQDPIIPATAADIDSAIAKAAAAQHQWAKTSFTQRRRLLKTLLKYVLAHQDDIVRACCLDSGKTKIDANFGEILVTAEKLQWTIKHGENALRPSKRPTNLLMCYKSNSVFYEPLGVVSACVSWNYPFHNFISPVISALFSGNAIIVKPSEQTAWSSIYFTNLIQDALKACGHSPDLLQNIICFPDAADHLTSHPTIKHITFIGSREVAHKVALSASKSLASLTVELGGKDPSVILDDPITISDIESIASILLRGVFQASGQNCIGIERVIALPQTHDLLVSTVKPLIQSLRLGSVLDDPTAPDIGSMISSRSFTRLEELISSAVASGAILHCGGKRFNHPIYPNGHYFQPTLLSNVTFDMEIAKTELFAPVFLLMRADTVDDAIAIANSTPYALGASVFSHRRPEVQKCIREIRAGNVAVNDFAAFYACSMPFGGRDGSGYGRFGGEEGLRGLCNVKSVCEDAWWARLLRIRTSIPPPLRYPVDGARGWGVCKGVVETGYATGLASKARGLFGLLEALMGGQTKTKVD